MHPDDTDKGREAVSYELFQSVLEIKTPPCVTAAEAEERLRELRNRAGYWATACGVALASAGTHPFSRYNEQKITNQDRYERLVEALGWIAKREVIFGQHVHVGVQSEEEIIEAHNRLSEQVPLFLALSANSPYWQGIDTGYGSTRVRVFETSPRSGLPPAFLDYAAFEDYVDFMIAAGAMDDYTHCWWDVRPHPKIGIIELRVLGSQTSLRSAVALTALIQCFVAKTLAENRQGPYDREIALENKWRASRHGLDATFYDAVKRISIPVRKMTRTLVQELHPISQDLGCENELRTS